MNDIIKNMSAVIQPEPTNPIAVNMFLSDWLGENGAQKYEAYMMDNLMETEPFYKAVDAACKKAMANCTAHLLIKDGQTGVIVFTGDEVYEERFFPLSTMAAEAVSDDYETPLEALRTMRGHLHDSMKTMDALIEKLLRTGT